MKFEDAFAEMKKLADSVPATKGYFIVQYSLTNYGGESQRKEASCQVYMHTYDYQTGKTWEEAITKMKHAVNPPPVDLGEAPQACGD